MLETQLAASQIAPHRRRLHRFFQAIGAWKLQLDASREVLATCTYRNLPPGRSRLQTCLFRASERPLRVWTRPNVRLSLQQLDGALLEGPRLDETSLNDENA